MDQMLHKEIGINNNFFWSHFNTSFARLRKDDPEASEPSAVRNLMTLSRGSNCSPPIRSTSSSVTVLSFNLLLRRLAVILT